MSLWRLFWDVSAPLFQCLLLLKSSLHDFTFSIYPLELWQRCSWAQRAFSPYWHITPYYREEYRPFSITTVKSNLTWDWTESCSFVLAMRLGGEEPQCLSSSLLWDTIATYWLPSGSPNWWQVFRRWWQITSFLSQASFAALCQNLTGFRPCRWQPIRIILILKLLILFPEKYVQ